MQITGLPTVVTLGAPWPTRLREVGVRRRPIALAPLLAHAHATGASLGELGARVISRPMPVEQLALDAGTAR
jgi:hypothetical protein